MNQAHCKTITNELQIAYVVLGHAVLHAADLIQLRPTAYLKASRPLIRVLVINVNGLWINDFI